MDIFYDGTKVTSTQASKPFPFSTNPVNGHDLVPKVKEWLWLSVGASFGDGDFQSQPAGLLSDALVEYVRVYKLAITLGTIELQKEAFEVYPNPAKEILNIKAPIKEYTLTIFDTNGQKILFKRMDNFKEQLNVNNYQKGIYLLKFQQNEKITYKKVVF
jgi:hypothetical protein